MIETGLGSQTKVDGAKPKTAQSEVQKPHPSEIVIGRTGIGAVAAKFRLDLQGSCMMWILVAVGAMLSDPGQPARR